MQLGGLERRVLNDVFDRSVETIRVSKYLGREVTFAAKWRIERTVLNGVNVVYS